MNSASLSTLRTALFHFLSISYFSHLFRKCDPVLQSSWYPSSNFQRNTFSIDADPCYCRYETDSHCQKSGFTSARVCYTYNIKLVSGVRLPGSDLAGWNLRVCREVIWLAGTCLYAGKQFTNLRSGTAKTGARRKTGRHTVPTMPLPIRL